MESLNWHTVFEFFGVLGIIGTFYFGLRPRRVKGRDNQLKYIPDSFFNVYKTLLSDDFNLEIKHNGTPINNNIYYVSGKLVLKGDIDTDENEISIELPTGWKWIDTSKEQSHEAINAEFKKDTASPNKANLTFKKFRHEDYININAIIEGSESTADFQKRIKFTHRIDKTDPVKVEDFETSMSKWFLIAAIPFFLTVLYPLLSNKISLFQHPLWELFFSLLTYLSLIVMIYVTKNLISHTNKIRQKYRNKSQWRFRVMVMNIAINSCFVVVIIMFIYSILKFMIPTLQWPL